MESQTRPEPLPPPAHWPAPLCRAFVEIRVFLNELQDFLSEERKRVESGKRNSVSQSTDLE